MSEKSWSILELLNTTTQFLNEKKIESARLNAELLLCSILNFERIQLYTNFDKPLSIDEIDKFRILVKRRVKNEPLQYILGQIDFCNLKIRIDNRALIPRPETEELVELVKNKCKNDNYKILDIGTGSGCIALSLANHYKNSEILGIDNSIDAIELAKSNSEINNIRNAKFDIFDILKSIPSDKYDIIVSNPPYISNDEMLLISKELNYEPQLALTDNNDGLTFYKRYIEIFENILNENGSFYLEIAYNQGNKILELFEQSNYYVELHKDLNGNDRIIYGKLRIK